MPDAMQALYLSLIQQGQNFRPIQAYQEGKTMAQEMADKKQLMELRQRAQAVNEGELKQKEQDLLERTLHNQGYLKYLGEKMTSEERMKATEVAAQRYNTDKDFEASMESTAASWARVDADNRKFKIESDKLDFAGLKELSSKYDKEVTELNSIRNNMAKSPPALADPEVMAAWKQDHAALALQYAEQLKKVDKIGKDWDDTYNYIKESRPTTATKPDDFGIPRDKLIKEKGDKAAKDFANVQSGLLAPVSVVLSKDPFIKSKQEPDIKLLRMDAYKAIDKITEMEKAFKKDHDEHPLTAQYPRARVNAVIADYQKKVLAVLKKNPYLSGTVRTDTLDKLMGLQ